MVVPILTTLPPISLKDYQSIRLLFSTGLYYASFIDTTSRSAILPSFSWLPSRLYSLPCFCVFLTGWGGLPHFHLKLSTHAITSTPPKMNSLSVVMLFITVFAQRPKARPLRLCHFGATHVFTVVTACVFAPLACTKVCQHALTVQFLSPSVLSYVILPFYYYWTFTSKL